MDTHDLTYGCASCGYAEPGGSDECPKCGEDNWLEVGDPVTMDKKSVGQISEFFVDKGVVKALVERDGNEIAIDITELSFDADFNETSGEQASYKSYSTQTSPQLYLEENSHDKED